MSAESVCHQSSDRSCFELYLSQATIDKQLNAIHIAAVIGGQKRDGLRDLIGGAGPPQRYTADLVLHVLIDLFLRHSERSVIARGRDKAGANCIDPYVALFQVHAPGARK